ncbi:hydroxypyruvate isomerase family protein [Alicyclobacillus fodiniaquatilis]|uniref:Hydroxypyruvate isomerase family protein n=1 Tax=Alicyclobacillus fodiniaquatilis TaxID=1661150 RepID=A0ABW4JMS3_9BACL
MIRFSAHLEMNFGSAYSFAERWQSAAHSQFQACEFVWRQHGLSEVLALREKNQMAITCLGGTTGFAVDGGRPLLTRPEDREWLVRDVQEAIDYAQQINCPNLVFVPGNLHSDWSIERHRQEAVNSFSAVAPLLEAAGVTAVLEPLNSKVDHRGIYCDTSAEAFRIVEQVGSKNVKILYDIYHMQIMEGNLIDTIRAHHALIGHYHVARVPGRNEPLGGEVNLPAVLQAIEETGYQGFVGMEYSPTGETIESFKQLREAYPASFG